MTRSAAKLWCPHCATVSPCKSVNFTLAEHGQTGRRFYKTDHADIHWFRRLRECSNCYAEFFTAEMDLDFVSELAALRDALKDIKENADEYEADAKKSAAALKKLSKSIKVLKAIK